MIRSDRSPRVAYQGGRRGGFTLVELMLVLFIFIVMGTGVVGAYLSIQMLSHHAEETMVAMEDLSDMMERIHATPFATLSTSFPNGFANGPATNIYAIIVGGYTLPGESVTVTYPSQSATRLEILVSISWASLGRARTLAVSTIKTSS